MSGIFSRLKILVRTNLIVSNREAANAFLSYVGYTLGALFLVGIAIVPVIGATSKDARPFPLVFILFVAMLDYFSIQSKLASTTLIDNSTIALFPLSRFRSFALRFVVLLLDRRILFYLLPSAGLIIILVGRASFIQLIIIAGLFAALYILLSEILFPVFILLRKLADRYSAKTITQMAAIPFLIVFLLPTLFHLREDFALQVPVVAQFVRAFRDILTSDTGGALRQLTDLVLIGAAYTAASVAATLVIPKIGIIQKLSWGVQVGKGREQKTFRRDSVPSIGNSVKQSYSTDASQVSAVETVGQTLKSCIFLDWKIRQKEERVIYTLVMYPVMGVWAGMMMSHKSNKPIDSFILLIFFIALLLGVAVTENHLTQRGLRLKHVSTFPLDKTRYVLMKSLSVWLLISGIDLLTVVMIGFWIKIGIYQELQGLVYSLYIPLVFLLSSNTLVLYFNSISRHPLIALVLTLAVGVIATFVYIMLMLFNLFVGLAVVVGLFLLTYSFWIPSWGVRLSSEFQILLEESK